MRKRYDFSKGERGKYVGRIAKRVATFTLKCVGCGKVEKRPAKDCTEQPFCSCGMPMILKEVET